eukprot:gnl/TRDRNA2_/TRDRNA2_170196_c0_seq1.p3 gnl/TRDRNA2_/TRDRNA2_170196_c0~~gnl/TRDRNA2_/TRDRNA2_170196_c0_seq1.p3  ORF type:complete len:103 (-),score=13.88 gnl/TRDRNA2_/TRDRNA2_170196_c0_seq1:18-326(-)
MNDGGEPSAATEGGGEPIQLELPVPRSFLCPITGCLMEEPVATVDGHIFEHAAIKAWFDTGRCSSPVTMAPLPTTALTADAPLRRAIEEDFLPGVRHVVALS